MPLEYDAFLLFPVDQPPMLKCDTYAVMLFDRLIWQPCSRPGCAREKKRKLNFDITVDIQRCRSFPSGSGENMSSVGTIPTL